MNADGIEADGKFPGWLLRKGVQDLHDCEGRDFLKACSPKVDSNSKVYVHI